MKLTFIKTQTGLIPECDETREILNKVKNGDGISILISERSSFYLCEARKYFPSLLKTIDEGLTEELDKSIKKPIEIVNLIFNYYIGDGSAEFVSGSEKIIEEVIGLVGEEASI